MTLAGEFNINFAAPCSESLVDLHRDKYDIRISNNVTESTTEHGISTDAVLNRYELYDSKLLVSYFTYHKPMCPQFH